MRKYVIMGVQGSGKGTHSAMLAEDLDLVHIGVGDILRWNVQHHTKLGAQIRRTMAAGSLVSDDVIEGVVKERLAQHDWNYGFIIDGFPRSERQAEFFLESYDIDGVVNLYLPDEEVAHRVLSRRLCSQCGMEYNLIADRPQREDTCDVCQGQLVARADDNPEALAVRLAAYHEETKPLIAIFERKEFVATIDATRSIEEVQANIRERFDLRPMT
jgi:adenylate kinase